MYAVVETGGKQYRVELGSELAVERLVGDPGDTINLDRVLLIADGDTAQVGTPVVADALVTASVVRHDRGEKLIVFKYRPKARHRSKKGHRQEQTFIRIADIQFNGRSAAKEAGEQEKQESKSRKAAAEAAQSKAAADQALAAKLAEQESAEQKAETDAAAPKKAPARKPKAEAAETEESAADVDAGANAKAEADAEPAAETAAEPKAEADEPASPTSKSTTAKIAAPKRTTKKKDE